MTATQPHSPVETLQRRILGAVIEPGDAGWDEATQAFNTHSSSSRRSSRSPRRAGRRRDRRRSPRDARAAGRPAAHRPQRGAARPAMDDLILVQTDLLQGVEIDADGAPRPRRARDEVGEVVPTRLRARPRRAARLDAGRQRRRLLARRRRRLVRPQARPGREQRPRDRARHRRRPAAPRRPRARRRSCSGRCAAAAATSASSPRSSSSCYPIAEVYAGVLFFPWERVVRGAARVARVDATTVPDEVTSVGRILQFPPLPGAAARCSAAGSSPSSRRSHRRRGARRGAARAAARARPGDGHLRDDRPGGARRAAHGPAGPAAVHRRGHDAGRAAGGGDRRVRRRRRAGLRLAARRPPRSGTSAARSPRRRPDTARSTRSTPRSSTFGVGLRLRRGDVRGEPRPAARSLRKALRRTTRPPVPQLHRGEDGRLDLLPAEGVPPAAGREGRGRPGRPLPREPPDPRSVNQSRGQVLQSRSLLHCKT